MSTIGIPIQQVNALPAILGEVDVLRTLQLLPGVQSGTDGASGLFVRGGSPDQTLLLLDGVQVYNASHLFGFFSVFNSDAIKHVELIKGGFPARYGGRLSSVVDIGMKEGNMKRFAAQGSIGIVASFFSACITRRTRSTIRLSRKWSEGFFRSRAPTPWTSDRSRPTKQSSWWFAPSRPTRALPNRWRAKSINARRATPTSSKRF